jgi:hypothetical protein
VLGHARKGGRTRGEIRGGGGSDGAPFISGRGWVGNSPRAAPRDGEGCGGKWGQRGGRAARRGW